MDLELSIVTGIGTLIAILLPFLIGKGGHLQTTASLNNVDHLLAVKKAILNKFIEEEQGFKNGEIGPNTWKKWRTFLVHRYIDSSHRLDYLRASGENKEI